MAIQKGKNRVDAKDKIQAESQPSTPQEGGSQAAALSPSGLKIDEAGATVTRADYFAGSFAITEGLLAFGCLKRDGSREVKIDTKVVVTMRDAKRILLTMQQLIKQYEEKYGAINV